MVESQWEERRIRCSGCQEHFWLRYQYTDKKPMTAAGIDCPHPSCHKHNRVYMPASATGVEVGTEAPPQTSHPEVPPPEPETPAVTSPTQVPTSGTAGAATPEAPRRRNVYWRPPRF